MPPRILGTAGTDVAVTSLGSHTVRATETHSGQSLHAAGIREVAAAAGVSIATVSRELRGLPRVSQTTRQRIVAAAASLGYVPSSAASELARRRGIHAAGVVGQLSRTVHAPAPSRGTVILIQELLTGPHRPEEPREPAMSEMEQVVHAAASANGFSACVKSCNPAEMLETVRSVPASVIGMIIETGGPSLVPIELRHALASACIPTVQIHLNISYDQTKELSASPPPSACAVVIAGAGIYAYKLAIDYLGAAVRPVPHAGAAQQPAPGSGPEDGTMESAG
jgi:3-dehydroquinate dehydratase